MEGQHLSLRASFNTRLTLTVLLIAVSQFNFGFDQQGFSSTQAMDAFAKQFGKYNEAKGTYALPTVWVSMFNSFIYLGQATGVILGSYISRRFGRRMCVFVMSIWALVYVYIGMELSVVPIFQSEITPRQARGFVVGTYQTSLFFGGLVINCICRGTGSLSGRQQYLIPWGLFYLIPTIVASCIWFVPESPRWLVMRGRREEARASLGKLRQGKFTDEEIDAELALIVAGIEMELEQGSFFELFHPRQIRRTGVVIGANFFLQATGQNFTSVYGALFAKSLGTINPFTVTVILAVVNTLTAIMAQFLTDKLGRRPQVFAGACIQTAALMTMGGLGTAPKQTHSIKSGIVAMMVVFTFGYSLGWAPTSHILSAEIPSTRMRDMTYRTASVINIAVQFVVTFSLPYLLNEPYANLGSKVGFIFGSIAAVSIAFAYFFVPDVSGSTLEEVDMLFASDLPIRKFKRSALPQTVPEAKGVDVLEVELVDAKKTATA
ncbi:hypothetical protein Sste5344_009963 [Sporothrix stenoceras]